MAGKADPHAKAVKIVQNDDAQDARHEGPKDGEASAPAPTSQGEHLAMVDAATAATMGALTESVEAETDGSGGGSSDGGGHDNTPLLIGGGVLLGGGLIALAASGGNNGPKNTAPTFGAAPTPSFAENTAAATVVFKAAATDSDTGDSITYSLSGADAALFTINGATGEVTFKASPDFENPTDATKDNKYELTVTATDKANATATQAVTVTVTNVNEAPVISSNGGGATAAISVAENTTAVTTVTATDVDAGSTRTFSITGGADAALFSIDAATGALAFKAAPDFEAPTDTGSNNVYDVTVRVSDNGNPALTDDQAIAVTVTDVAEPAVIAGAQAGTVAAGSTTASGTLTVADPDAGQSTFQAQVATKGVYGSFSLAADGKWTYTVDNTAAATQALPAGATATDTITVKSADGTTSTVTITVPGVNDAPVGVADTAAVTEAGAAGAGVAVATGNVLTNDTDPDTGDTKTVGAITGGTVGTDLVGTYGKVNIAADGSYTYTLDNTDTDTQALTAGASATDVFTYTVKDAGGLTSTATLTVTVTGANDAAVIGGAKTGGVTEDAVPNTATGALTVTDVDAGEASFQAQAATKGTYGSFALATDGKWTYTLDNSLAVTQALAGGATANDVFTVKSADGTTDSVTITVTGANDAPVGVNDAAAVVEAGVDPGNTAAAGTPTATGNVLTNDTDVDAGDTRTVSAVAGGAVGTDLVGTYGKVNIAANGAYTYTLDNADADTNKLAKGATATDSFTYTVKDAGGLTSTATLTVTVTGTNDAPVATNDAFAATEGGAALSGAGASVALNDSDPDAGAALSYALVGAAAAGLTFNANGSFTFDPTNAAYDHIAQGATQDVVAPYTVTDEFGASSSGQLTITVTGVNDAPVFTSGATGSVTENQPISTVVYDANATDADDGASLTYSLVPGGNAALLAINPTTGVVTALAPLDFAVTPTLNFTVQVSDGIAAPVSQAVTISVIDQVASSLEVDSDGNSVTLAASTLSATDANGKAYAIVGPVVPGLDASGKAVTYSENANAANTVLVSNFGRDDHITVTGASGTGNQVYNFTTDGQDLTITYNSGGTVSQIILDNFFANVGVTPTPGQILADFAAADPLTAIEARVGFDFFSYA